MRIKTITSLILAAIAVNAASCAKESAPVAANKPVEAPKPAAVAVPAGSGALATISAPAPETRAQYQAGKPPVVASVAAPVPAPPAATGGSPTAPVSPITFPSGADPRADLKTVIPEIMRLIKAKDYVTMFKELTPPSKLAGLPPGANIEVIARAATQDSSFDTAMSEMLEELQAIAGHSPTLDDSGNKATFALIPAVGEDDEVVFVKENGLWFPGGN